MKKLYEGNIKKNFFIFALPLILTALLSQLYGTVNTIMAGQLIGDKAISAIGSTAAFDQLISSIFWGYGTGFSLYVAMLFGKGDYQKMVNVVKTNILISSFFIILTSVLCISFHRQIFDFLNIESDLREDAFAYYSIYLIGMVFLNINWCGVYISNAIGISTLSFGASIISNILNITLNYILIKFVGLGIRGAAIATVISSFCVSVFYIIMLARAFKKLGANLKGIYFNKYELKTSWSYSFPNMLQQSVMYLCTALVSPLTNLCGASAIAGYTIGMRLYTLNSQVYQNSTKTVSNFIAQCVGAGKINIIRKGIKIGIIQTTLFLLPFLLVTVLGSEFISKLFLKSPESIYYAEIFMKYCMPFIFFNVINNLLHAIFRSVGAGHYLVISTCVYSLSRLGFSYLLYSKFEIYGIFTAIVLSWITEAIFGLILYFSGKWKSAEYRVQEKNNA